MSIVANKGATVVSARSSSTPTRLGALALAATMLAACSVTPGSDDAGAAYPTPDATVTTEPPPAPPVAAEQGALDEFTMRIWGTPAEETQQAADARLVAEQRFREEYIAACMAEQGFQYYPDLLNIPTVTVAEGPVRGSREFAERYGFGISNQPPQGAGFQVQWHGDPNQELRETMSAAEQEAWLFALSGTTGATQIHIGGGLGGVGMQLDETGCIGRAWSAMLPTGNPEFAAIESEVSRFVTSIDVDPLLLALDHEWAACLALAGYPGMVNPGQMTGLLWAEWDALQNWDQVSELLLTWDWQGSPDGPPGYTVDEDGVGSFEFDPEARAAFRDREMALAVADVGCRETLDFDARRLAIKHQLQQEFVDANRNELDTWATWAENRRAGR